MTSWKNKREQRLELGGLEQRDVERVLEVGGAVRRDHERGAVVGGDPGELGDVLLGRDEVLDDVRRADPVDRTGDRAPMRAAVHRREAQALRAPLAGGVDRGLRAVVDADDQAADSGEAGGLLADPAADVEHGAGAERSVISRYPASWNASSESGVAPAIGRSPVSFAIRCAHSL